MFETTDRFTINVKTKVKNIKSTLSLLIGLCVVMAIIYFLYYWIMYGSGDETAFEYTRAVFDPIATYFHSDITDISIYQATSFTFLKFVAPLYAVHLVAEGVQKILLDTHEKITGVVSENKKKKEQEEYLDQYIKIKYFSIAVSFDYNSNNSTIPTKAIYQLNNVIFDKIQSNFVYKKGKIEISGIFTFVSSDFENYDILFDKLLKLISKIKDIISNKYNIEVIPTITTDAYMEVPQKNKIVSTHFAIKGCNLKNKVINTYLFIKKYGFLGFHKYSGTSIGIYNIQTSELGIDESLDLYVVIKNLNDYFSGF